MLGALGEEVGDALEHGVDPGRVAGGDAGDEVLQPVLVGASEADVPLRRLLLGPLLLVGRQVGLDDLGLRDGEHSPGRLTHDRVGHR